MYQPLVANLFCNELYAFNPFSFLKPFTRDVVLFTIKTGFLSDFKIYRLWALLYVVMGKQFKNDLLVLS